MNPEKGQKVQVRFNNGIYFDAIVEEWTDNKSKLILMDGEQVIIQKTLQDVLLVKIIEQTKTTLDSEVKSEIKPKLDKPVLIDKLEKIRNNLKNELALKEMAELKDELNKIERQETFNSMDKFKDTGLKEVHYAFPRNIQIDSPTQYSKQKITPTNSEFDSELQSLFKQKHK